MNFDVPGDIIQYAVFALFALVAIVAAIKVVTASDPFVSAISLLFNFGSLGVMYLLLNANFVAVSQILVYAGAVVVLFLFVIAYLGDRREIFAESASSTAYRAGAALSAVVVAVLLITAVVGGTIPAGVSEPVETAAGYAFGSAQAVGESFMGTYLVAFEVTSLVLLVAAVGGITLGLTGRARNERLRKLNRTRSADEQRKWYEEREQELRERRREQLDADAESGESKEPAQ